MHGSRAGHDDPPTASVHFHKSDDGSLARSSALSVAEVDFTSRAACRRRPSSRDRVRGTTWLLLTATDEDEKDDPLLLLLLLLPVRRPSSLTFRSACRSACVRCCSVVDTPQKASSFCRARGSRRAMCATKAAKRSKVRNACRSYGLAGGPPLA